MKMNRILTCCVMSCLLLLISQDAYSQDQSSVEDPDRAAYTTMIQNYQKADNEIERLEALVPFIEACKNPGYAELVVSMAVRILLPKGDTDFQEAVNYLARLERLASNIEVRALIRRHLIDLHGRANNSREVKNTASKLIDGRKPVYDDHISIAQAANAVEAWELALPHAEKAIVAAMDYVIPEDMPQLFRQQERLGRTGKAFAAKGWALANLGKPEEALEIFEEAVEHTMFNYVGMPFESDLQMYWGKTLLMLKRYEEAMEKFAPNAIFGDEGKYLDSLKQAYSLQYESNGEQGFERFLWEMRKRHSVPIQDFALKDYNGNTVSLSSLRGKVVLLNFWFPHCGFCRAELPRLKQMYERLKDRGFEIVVVDDQRDTESALKFIKDNDLPYLFLEDGEGEDDVVQNIFGVYGFPTAFLLDRAGRIMYFHLGYSPGEEEQLEMELVTLLDSAEKMTAPDSKHNASQ